MHDARGVHTTLTSGEAQHANPTVVPARTRRDSCRDRAIRDRGDDVDHTALRREGVEPGEGDAGKRHGDGAA